MRFILLLFLFLTPILTHAKTDNLYTIAKRQGLVIYQTNPYTFYCHIPFDHHGRVQVTGGSYLTDKNSRIQWEHIVPVRRFAHEMSCWKQPLCIDKKGHPFKGRRCCHLINDTFQKMEADLHNLVPVLPKINQARSYFDFQENIVGDQPLPHCDLKVNKKNHIVSPPPSTRGFIARAYLYMHQTYGISLTEAELQQFHRWNLENPPDAWERQRHQKILEKQGTTNPFITD